MGKTAARTRPETNARGERVFWVLGIFAFALLVRAVHLWQIRGAPFFRFRMVDAERFHAWAQEIAGGEWLGREVFYQAPLYPYFLGGVYAALGDDVLVVRGVQAVLGAAACGLLAMAGWRLFGKAAGIAAGLIMAGYAPAVFFGSLIQKPVLDLLLVSLMLWLVCLILDDPRRGRWWWLGVVLAALILTRENAVVFVAAILVWLAVHYRDRGWERLAFAGLFVGGLVVVLLPVAVRNAVVGGEFHVTTSSFGPNFYLGNNAKADGGYVALRPLRGSIEFERIDAVQLAEEAEGRPLSHTEVSSYWTRRALDYITSHPLDWIWLKVRTLAMAYNGVEKVDTEDLYTYAEYSLPLRVGNWVLHFGVLAPLAVMGVWITWGERRRLWLFYLMIVLYTAAVVIFFVFGRYRLPLVPLLVLFAAAGVTRFVAWWRSSSAGAIAGCLTLVAATAVFCNWPLMSVDAMRSITHYNIGAKLAAAGEMDAAIGEYRRALEWDEQSAAAHNGLGSLLEEQRNYPDAEEHLRRAVRLRPDYPEAHYNLGNLLVDLQNLDDAAAEFQRAIVLKPDYVDPYVNLGRVYFMQGNLPQAAATYERALKIEPDHFEAHFNLGLVAANQKNLGRAEIHYRRAVKIRPEDVKARIYLGDLLANRGDLEEAANHLREATRLDEDNARVYNALGHVLKTQDRKGEAAAMFLRAIAIDPDYANALTNLGDLRFEQKNLADAAAYYERALRANPDSLGAAFNLGKLRTRQQKWPEAARQFERVIQINPNFAPAHFSLGEALMQQDKLPQAARSFERALEIQPNYAQAKESLEKVQKQLEAQE